MNSSTTQVSNAASLMGDYVPLPNVYDEAVDHNGNIRESWKPFLQGLSQMGGADLQRRLDQAQRQILRDGFTFNPYEAGPGGLRPWVLDAIPLLIREQEWNTIEEGLGQRARLLDLILKDLFGPKLLLKDRHLPPAAFFGHPSYYPSYQGLASSEYGFLHLYAADLARSPDGTWWVVGDRSRAPFGLGYVLENRIVTSRMLPTQFRKCNVQRLASFFIALKESLRVRAPRFKDNPRVVIWTQGPQSKAYFEDAYLARYLGYHLVEGGDLAVRENRVMLKTLGGLLPVEVILRRLEDDDCDPVELRSDSAFGIAGLLEVLRSGNLAIANSLGSQLVESPLFMAFLPSLCQVLLGEDLKMPSVATWWCGEKDERQYVLDHLEELIIRPAYRVADVPPLRPELMTRQEKQELRAKIKADPHAYVGQETVTRSTSPVWLPQGMKPWSLAVRSFLVRNGDDYLSLPGGLARVASEPHLLEKSTNGERSQDVWILAEKPIEEVSLLSPPGQLVRLRRSGAELPSRVADNLFWLGRNVERAEGSARLLRTLLASVTGENDSGPEIRALLRALAEQGQIDPDYAIPGLDEALPAIELMLPIAINDTSRPKSLRTTIRETFRLISIVRDRMSLDAWRIIHRIEETSGKNSTELAEVLEFLDRLILDLVAFSGLAAESMTRTQGWRFLDLGRRLERAWQSCMLLRSTLTGVAEEEQQVLEAVLQTADSMMTYRSRYMANVQMAPVLDLLLTDETNPRSVAYQLVGIVNHVNELPRSEQLQAVLNPEQKLALSLQNSVRLADVYELSQESSHDERGSLDRLLKRLVDQLPRLSDAVSGRFLIHAGVPRHFASALERPQ